jgi:putative membrane protein
MEMIEEVNKMFPMWDMSLGMGWWWVFGGVWMLIFWGGLIALIVWGIKKLTERGGTTSKRDPLDVAKERYARGEISREEFEQIKKDLF